VEAGRKIPAEDVGKLPKLTFSQVIFRLPNNLPTGACTAEIKAQDQISNAGIFKFGDRVAQCRDKQATHGDHREGLCVKTVFTIPRKEL
jgi:hypothetical protein